MNDPGQDRPFEPSRANPVEPTRWPANFREQLNANAAAAAAHSKLVNAGVPNQRLTTVLYKASRFLRWRARYDKTPQSFSETVGLDDARSVDRLVKRVRRLADELDDVDRALIDSGLPVAFVSEPWNSNYFETLASLDVSVPEVLRAHASFLESAGPSVEKQPRISVAEIVEDFLVWFVKEHSKAKAPHYAEVTDLVNWLYELPGCGGFHTTEESLSRRAQRRWTSPKP